MSGIAGIVNLDGAPLDRSILDRMAALLEQRGPDRTGIRVDRSTGLVHTLFSTTNEAGREQQPMSLDGETWITADARIDGRDELIAELGGHGCPCSHRSTDAELILYSYSIWRGACVEHLIGDFAFAIWDGIERKLFCARDHFGIRPFFYAHEKGTFVFASSIDAVRLHPSVPDGIDELAIADFLVTGANYHLDRTAREAIRRLAPAHVLTVYGEDVRTRRYWTLPVDPPTVFRRSRDYVERFLDLFERAVTDRMRTDRAAVLMSGGLDSSSVAAMAKCIGDKGDALCSISAHTQTFDRLFPYEEGRLAQLAARKIGIPWNGVSLDDRQLLGYWDRPEFRRPEPWTTPFYDGTLADTLGKPLPARVVLTGQGGDGIFSSLRTRHCRERIREGRWLNLARELSGYLLSEGRLRRLQLRGHLRSRLGGGVPPRPFPSWLNPDFERRLQLRERYRHCALAPTSATPPAPAVRPEAYSLMSSPTWAILFEEYDPECLGACVESRHPFFDLRLVRHALSLPALPWCTDKELLRRSMRGLLPDDVRLAAKRPIMSDFLTAEYRNSRKEWLENFEPVKELSRFVDVKRVVEQVKNPPPWESAVHLRPVCLNLWLKWESEYPYKLRKEGCRAYTQ